MANERYAVEETKTEAYNGQEFSGPMGTMLSA